MHQAAQRGLAEAGKELDRFHRLKTSNHTREHAQDTGFTSCRDGPFGRWFRQEAAVTRSTEVGSEDGELSFELKDGPVDERHLQKKGSVIGGKAGGEVVGAIEEGIVGGEEFERVGGGELPWVKNDFDVGIDLAKAGAGAFELGLPDETGVVKDLTMEIGTVDDIGINEPDLTHPGGGEVEDGRRTEPTGADTEDGGPFESLLTNFADLRQHGLAKVAGLFLGRERHAGNLWTLVR